MYNLPHRSSGGLQSLTKIEHKIIAESNHSRPTVAGHLAIYGTVLSLGLFASGCALNPTESQATPNSPTANPTAVITDAEEATPSAPTPASETEPETAIASDTSPVQAENNSPKSTNVLANAVVADSGGPTPTTVEDRTVALNDIVNQLGPICAPLTEATYQSQYLLFPDTDITVHVNGQLQKIVDPDSALRQSDSPDYCYPDQRATPAHALVIKQGGASILIDMDADLHGYAITAPLSFSADGRYLVAAVDIAYTGGDPGAYSIIFDLDRRDKLAMESYICADADFDEYLGFTQSSEVAFRCSIYGDLDNWIEILDLETRSIYKPTTEPETLENYGTVTQPFQYTLHRP